MGKMPIASKGSYLHKIPAFAGPTPLGGAKPPPNKPLKLKTREDVLRALQIGIDLQRAGKLEEAEYYYQTVLFYNPKQPDALNLMGVLAADGKMFELSAEFLEKANKHRPRDVIIMNNLANAYILMGSPSLAIPMLKNALKISSEYFETTINLARAERALGQATQSLSSFEAALSKKPGNIDARIGMGQSLVDAGRLSEAIKLFEELIKEQPTNSAAYLGLSSAKKFTPDDTEPEAIEAILQDESLSDNDREFMHHAIAKMYNDMKHYDDAFHHFQSEKKLAGSRFSLSKFRKEIENTIKLFDHSFFENRRNFGVADESPVFIIGMPRSGTTLTEQIISSHPDVFGAGELQNVHILAKNIVPLLDEEVKTGCQKFNSKQSKKFAKRYISEVQETADEALRVSDKMPHNFLHLGLIAILFPKAKIIHCRRDPMDNCVSCFTNKFNQVHGYNTDLETMGLYYREYRKLMDHWSEVLPIDILHVQYEETIADQNGMSRRLIDHVGLPWDDVCLRFYESDRDVSTPSRWQVRQPIYKSSVQRWRNYEGHLGSLKKSLGPYFVED